MVEVIETLLRLSNLFWVTPVRANNTHNWYESCMSGRPMIYQLEKSGFILRGVGPNGIDDGNKKYSDDWLWTYSTNTASAKE
jgi:hypothetical protein